MDSDTEFIDNSIVSIQSDIATSIFVAGSEDESISSSNEEEDQEKSPVLMIPKSKRLESPLDTSFVGRKNKKRIMIIDSDADNSIVVQHNRNKKLACLQDTPIKFTTYKNVNHSQGDSDVCESDVYDTDPENNNQKGRQSNSDDECESHSGNESDCNEKITNKSNLSENNSHNAPDLESLTNCDEDDDEELMVFSKATRMSIAGVVPRHDDDDSDDSDFILSDESNPSSVSNSINSLSEAPKVSRSLEPQKTADSSRISCSPFSSPVQNKHESMASSPPVLRNSNKLNCISRNSMQSKGVESDDEDLVIIEDNSSKMASNMSRVSASTRPSNKENVTIVDEDVAIIDSNPEVIALSSDDEDEVKLKSPKLKKEPDNSMADFQKNQSKDIRQYLKPESYPNQVVYVKKHVRENELRKLEGLKADLHGVRVLLEKMNPSYLPDTGSKLGERLASLEKQVRIVGTKVANMVVEPEDPTAEQMAADGFGTQDSKTHGLTWEDIQAGSNAVQPRFFGKQGMATHMAERNLILERLRDLHASLASRPAETVLATPPQALSATLLPHQAHALAWLQWRETQRPAAGILADDMGLGKTVTMIALVAADKERAATGDSDSEDDAGSKLLSGGTLVVCPASLVQQWANEVSKHCKPHQLTVSIHHGANRSKHATKLAHTDIVLTTYAILHRDGSPTGVLGRVRWRRIILDEAHVVRNHKSITSNAVCNLKGSRRWCLTGTPVQNKDLDLFALVKFMRCSPFDDLVMWKKWIDNKSTGGQERMSTVMQCLLLRRSKAQLQQKGQLACLPPRTPHLTEVTLSPDEMNVYQKVLVFSKTLFAQFLQQRAEKQSGGGGLTSVQNEYDKMHKKMIALQGAKPVKSHEILVLLLRLRQVCCHCGLVAAMLDQAAPDAREDPGSQDLLAELSKLNLDDSSVKSQEEEAESSEGTSVNEALRSVLSPNNPVFNLTQRSSKITAVMECLENNVFKNKGEKAIVVSQWTSVLRLVGSELSRRRVACVALTGEVPVPQRQALVNKINDAKSDITVMLLSLCAGGVGLNLCGANHLLLLDPHWNPQLEEQAQDRIYRVGQTRPVHIYRFMCVDTVEQSIRKLQEAKLKLAETVLTGAKDTGSKLSIEDLKMLFNMGNPVDG